LSLTRAERKAMGKRGRRYAEEAFSWDSIGARMADVYRWLALGGAPPSCVRQT
jgi:glycosyltransferase involved in cell wall biosynthesis